MHNIIYLQWEFHQQTDGVAMGGPASSIVAEIYMLSIETTAITTADTPPRIPVIKFRDCTSL